MELSKLLSTALTQNEETRALYHLHSSQFNDTGTLQYESYLGLHKKVDNRVATEGRPYIYAEDIDVR